MSTQLGQLRAFLAPDVHLDRPQAGQVHVGRSGTPVFRFDAVAPEEDMALGRLVGGGVDIANVHAPVADEGSAVTLARWYHKIRSLERVGLLRYGVFEGDDPVALAMPLNPGFHPEFTPIPARPVALSPFAVIQTHETTLCVESPRSPARVTLVSPISALVVHGLAQPRTAEELARAVPAGAETVEAVLMLLDAAALLKPGPAERSGPSSSSRLTSAEDSWEREDLRFHAHSRLGHHDRPLGGVFPGGPDLNPPAVAKAPATDRFVPLERPLLSEIGARDPSLLEAMEERRSVRDYAEQPLDVAQLSEFLFRVARIKEIRTAQSPHVPPRPYEVSSRPYPSGGSAYPLELYLMVEGCRGVSSGLYHYDARCHRLVELTAEGSRLDRLARAYGWTSIREAPPVVIVLTARLARTSWKYASVSYSLILKEVGAVMQNMYLVATAMGLAPCALGSGDDVEFGRIAELDPASEVAVGEFMLGLPKSD